MQTRHRLALALLAGLAPAACDREPPTSPEPEARVGSVSVTAPASALLVGDTVRLGAAVADSAGAAMAGVRVEWSSSAPEVARVDSLGLVTALARGEATVTAVARGVKGTLAVTVDRVGELPALRWQTEHAPSLTAGSILHLWGFSASDAYAVTGNRELLRYDGQRWRVAGTTPDFVEAVWPVAPDQVYATAAGSVRGVFRFDGTSWNVLRQTEEGFFRDVWASSPADVFALHDTYRIDRFDGTAWSSTTLPGSPGLGSVWGSGPRDVFAVGQTIWRFDGAEWRRQVDAVIGTYLYDVWGSGPNDVFAVGQEGSSPAPTSVLLHWNGVRWSRMEHPPVAGGLRQVWGTGAGNVFALGGGTILRYDGTRWSRVETGGAGGITTVGGTASALFFGGPSGRLYRHDASGFTLLNLASSFNDVWGAPDGTVFAVGEDGMTMVRRGGAWTLVQSGTTSRLSAVWASSGSSAFAVGPAGLILHFDGTAWRAQASGTTRALSAVWGRAPNDVYAVGDGGTVLRYDGSSWRALPSGTTANLRSVWGRRTGDTFFAGGLALLAYDGSGVRPVSLPAEIDSPFMQVLSGTGDTLLVGGIGRVPGSQPGRGGSYLLLLRRVGDAWTTVLGPAERDVTFDGWTDMWVANSEVVYGRIDHAMNRVEGKRRVDLSQPNVQAVWGRSALDVYVAAGATIRRGTR